MVKLADNLGGHFMDQFTYSERATDNNNITDTIFDQTAGDPHPLPSWIVCGAGTGGSSATLGRFVRYQRHRPVSAQLIPQVPCCTITGGIAALTISTLAAR